MVWLERYRTIVISTLIIIILAGGTVLLYRYTYSSGSGGIVISPPATEISVYIEGEVVNPGTYILEDGARVEDAIDAAGGMTLDAELGILNIAAPLRDGDHIHVYGSGEIPQRININTAEAGLLQALPGIGETLSLRIIDYREQNGHFLNTGDIKLVDGIGPATYEDIKDKITVH